MDKLIYSEEDLKNACYQILGFQLDIKNVRTKGKYSLIYFKRKPYRLHRLLGEYYFGDLVGFHIHHLNQNTFDNRKENLVKVTPSEHTSIYHYDAYKFRSEENTKRTQKRMVDKITRHEVTHEKVKKMRENGLTYREISQALKCGKNTVWRRINGNPVSLDWSQDE